MTNPDNPRTPRLEAVGLSIRFGPVIANDRVNLAVWPGEVHCVLGENGAGKSTLMKLLYGVFQPDEGQVKLGGRTGLGLLTGRGPQARHRHGLPGLPPRARPGNYSGGWSGRG